MKVEIEFDSAATGSSATFKMYFDNDIPYAAEGKILLSTDKVKSDYNSQFERILVDKIINTRGVSRIDILSRREMLIECIDMVVDENNEPIFGDDGWFKIHNSLVEAVKNYYETTQSVAIDVIFYDDYPEDFILVNVPLTDEEIEELEEDQAKSGE